MLKRLGGGGNCVQWLFPICLDILVCFSMAFWDASVKDTQLFYFSVVQRKRHIWAAYSVLGVWWIPVRKCSTSASWPEAWDH